MPRAVVLAVVDSGCAIGGAGSLVAFACHWSRVPSGRVLLGGQPVGVGGEGFGGDAAATPDPDGVDVALLSSAYMVVRPMDRRWAASSTVSRTDAISDGSWSVLIGGSVGGCGSSIRWSPFRCSSAEVDGRLMYRWCGWLSPRGAPVGLPGGGSGVQGWCVPCGE
jgi:hypothetical protein